MKIFLILYLPAWIDLTINWSFSHCILLPWISLNDLILVLILFIHFDLLYGLVLFRRLDVLIFKRDCLDNVAAFSSLMMILWSLFILQLFFYVIEIILVEMGKYICAGLTFEDNFLLGLGLIFRFGLHSCLRIIDFWYLSRCRHFTSNK